MKHVKIELEMVLTEEVKFCTVAIRPSKEVTNEEIMECMAKGAESLQNAIAKLIKQNFVDCGCPKCTALKKEAEKENQPMEDFLKDIIVQAMETDKTKH